MAAAALTAWITASLRGGASADDVTDAAARAGMQRIRSAHQSQPVIWGLAGLRASGYRAGRLVLPAPGDLLGLTGPSDLNRRAVGAGAAVVLTDEAPAADRAAVLVPAEDGDWAVAEVPLGAAVVSAWPSVRQARAEFVTAVAGHGAALADLDVAADARGLRSVVVDEDEQPLPTLPPQFPDDARELLGRARLVAVLAATATHDDGAAVSAAEASSRSAHLRSLSTIARRAIAAAGSAG